MDSNLFTPTCRTTDNEVRIVAVDEVPDVSAFDRSNLRLSPEMHQVQAEMAAERGEEYDPYAFEARCREQAENMPDPIEDAEPVE